MRMMADGWSAVTLLQRRRGEVAGVAAFAHKDASFRAAAGRGLLKRLADRL
jgi:hypothetical protein